tara:strand:- start:1236 stop:1502 length:267 start_codon:yes stop_codon:yes gene_type:complete
MYNKNSEILNNIVDRYEEDILKADGLDKAVIGIDEHSMRLIYSYTKIIQILMEDMTREEAEDWFGYNIQSAWVGDKTPIYCMDDFEYL